MGKFRAWENSGHGKSICKCRRAKLTLYTVAFKHQQFHCKIDRLFAFYSSQIFLTVIFRIFKQYLALYILKTKHSGKAFLLVDCLEGNFLVGEKMDTCKYPWRFEFTGIIPKEKSKVLTVRDVKRQSEQRKENHKTRREDFSPGQLWCHHVAIETALSFLIRVNRDEGVDNLFKKKQYLPDFPICSEINC